MVAPESGGRVSHLLSQHFSVPPNLHYLQDLLSRISILNLLCPYNNNLWFRCGESIISWGRGQFPASSLIRFLHLNFRSGEFRIFSFGLKLNSKKVLNLAFQLRMTESGGSWRDSYKGMSSDNIKGLVLALSSSLFIGASFIVKKKGLKKAGSTGTRAGVGGYSYLYEPLWWIGMITMLLGEIANFAAYAFAPAILVTPLGAVSIIISAVLAHIILREKLHIFGILGCALCVVGSTTIVLHAPQEREIDSVIDVWNLATEPAFMFYSCLVIGATIVLIIRYVPQYGQTNIMVYIGICSLVGSLSVMSVKALGIALKLTFSGTNQLFYPQTWIFTLVVLTCVITQLNYLNKALDTFNTAIVSPIYYVMFTSLTILASVIMFKDWDRQNSTQIVTEMCGFVTILSGTFLLHRTNDMVESSSVILPLRISKHINEEEGIPLRRQESLRSP